MDEGTHFNLALRSDVDKISGHMVRKLVILYCHTETVNIGGFVYNYLKKSSADAGGFQFFRSPVPAGRSFFDWPNDSVFVYPLTGVNKILAANIYATYRAASGIVPAVHLDIDIDILENDGVTVRNTIATDVSNSPNLALAWATYTGANYALSDYTVVDQTDWLRISYYLHAAGADPINSVWMQVDDNSLPLADQTRNQDWTLESAIAWFGMTGLLKGSP